MSSNISPVHNWAYSTAVAGYVPPSGPGVVRVSRSAQGTLAALHVTATSLTSPVVIERLAGYIQQGADIVRVLNDPQMDAPALRARVAELEAR